MVPERIFHIATEADWRRTLQTGTYTTSTVGRGRDVEDALGSRVGHRVRVTT